MQLVVAEKPSVARDLARVLGVPVTARGQAGFEGDRHVITWCIGHLVELEEPAAYDPRWKSWRLDTLPMLPEELRVRPAKHARQQLRTVRALLRDRRFTSVVNACDAGREGELIFRYVYQYAGSRLPVHRLWISSLTDEAIRRGFAALRPGRELDALGDAARCRSEADWLVGMNATRAVTVRSRVPRRPGDGDERKPPLYSIGRVQTPTLAMLVERERAIRAFVPRPYWEVRGELATATGERFVATWRAAVDLRKPGEARAGRLAEAALADELVARDRGAPAVVECVVAKTVREPPPLLFDLTALQRTANRRFGFSAARTLELAQALYERHKLVTYPRTDSRHLSADVVPELPRLFEALAAVPDYTGFAAVLVATVPRPGRRIVDDAKVSDHHAIIPTPKPPRLDALDRDERRLFDLIARRFLAAFFPDAEIAHCDAVIRVGRDAVIRVGRDASGAPPAPSDEILTTLPAMPDRYVARGRVRVVAGWQDVAGIAPPSSTDREGDDTFGALPALVEGQPLRGQYAAVEKRTTPPPRFSEATLLGAMESAGRAMDDEAARAAMKDRGLGTPATRASIIETLLRRGYLERAKQQLVPTAMGIALIEMLPVASLASPELTGAWEARLARVARGEDTRTAFMADIARYVRDTVDAIRSMPAGPPPSVPPPSSAPAPAWSSKPAKPQAKRAARPKQPRTVTAAVDAGALTCPRCRAGTLLTGARGWGCARWREGCKFVVWFETAGKRLTAAQLRDLVTRGKTRKSDFAPDGSPRAGRVVLVADRDGGATRFEPG